MVGKRRDHTSSKREGNVAVWKQEKCFLFVVEQGEGCSFLLPMLTLSPQHLSTIYQFMRLGWVLLYSLYSEDSRRWKLH